MEKEHACSCGHSHEHSHDDTCSCGHSHEHSHDDTCSCGHSHEHSHDDACSCGHHHDAEEWAIPPYDGELSEDEKRLLDALVHYHYLPVARFTMTSSKEDELYAIAMEPVYITSVEETMDEVRQNGLPFASLEKKGLISLDYDMPLKQFDYSLYENSALYAYFKQTVAESTGHEGFLYDTPNLEKGSVALCR